MKRESLGGGKRTDLDEPYDDHDGDHGSLDCGQAFLTERLLVGVLGIRGNALVHVGRSVLEDGVEAEGARDDGEDEMRGQHGPENGHESSTSHDGANQTDGNQYELVFFLLLVAEHGYDSPEDGDEGEKDVHDDLHNQRRFPDLCINNMDS
jgi:hypothetical protein